MSNPIISVITALVLCISSGTMGTGTEVMDGTGESGWGQLAGAPQEVQAAGQVVKEWFGAYLADDAEQARQTYHPSRRNKAEHDLEQLKKLLETVPGWRFRPMVIMAAGWEARVISSGLGGSDATVLIVHLKKNEGRWKILYWSVDSLRAVPDFYPQFRREYPDALIWFDNRVEDWLKPQKEAQIDIDIEELFKIPSPKKEDTLARKLREARDERATFESYFPDSTLGGETLDSWWKTDDKESYSDDEIFTIIRNGLRRAKDGKPRRFKERFIHWVGLQYIWGKEPKNKKAVQLMYYASFDPDLTGSAVYHGLSVAGDQQAGRVLKRLVDICMSDINTGRILWGTQGKYDKMLPYLKPYLNDTDAQVRQRASVLEKVFKGHLDYEQWQKEQFTKQLQADFGYKMDSVREVLLKGNSRQRRDMFAYIRSYGLGVLFDESFVDVLKACLKDSDPVVKEMALAFGRELICRVAREDSDMVDSMAQLAQDSDSKVREQVAIFVGSCWIWEADKQKDEAIEIMLQLSEDKNLEVRNAAVYYGLSVVTDKSDEVIRRLVDMIFESDDGRGDSGRIIWGLRRGTDKEKVRAYLQPFIGLRDSKGELARKAYFEIFKEELQTEAVIF